MGNGRGTFWIAPLYLTLLLSINLEAWPHFLEMKNLKTSPLFSTLLHYFPNKYKCQVWFAPFVEFAEVLWFVVPLSQNSYSVLSWEELIHIPWATVRGLNSLRTHCEFSGLGFNFVLPMHFCFSFTLHDFLILNTDYQQA